MNLFRFLVGGVFLSGGLGLAQPAPASAPAARPVFTSSAKGHVFTAPEGEIVLRLPAAPEVAGGAVSVKDEYGKTLRELPVAAGAETVAVTLPSKGFYALEARITRTDGTTQTVITSAAVVGPLPDERLRRQSRLGLWTVQGDPALALAAGANWNRQMTSVRNYEPDFLRLADPREVPPAGPAKPTPFTQVGVFSFGLPLWMMVPGEAKAHGFGNPLRRPNDWTELRRLIQAFVNSKGPDFPPYFEVFNEPEWQWKGSNEDLVTFLATVADGIKAARPDVKVLGPGFSSIRIKDPARLDLATAHAQGLLDHLDGIVVHAYVDGSAPEGEFIQRVQALQAWLAEIGRPEFPIHLTEFGWTSQTGTWQKPVDELTQARYATRSLALLAALGVENATYFCLKYNTKNTGEQAFSLLRPDDTPKPGYAAFANVARWLAGVQGRGQWLRITPTTHLLLFKKEGTTVAVAWDAEQPGSLALPARIARAEDMTGRALATTGAVALSPSPVFLEFASGAAPEVETRPVLRLMRGTTAALPGGPEAWIAPAPLRLSDNRLSAPAGTPVGDYLLLAQTGRGWRAQPVEVIPPLETRPAAVRWPAGEAAPVLSVPVRSHAPVELGSQLTLTLKDARDRFVGPVAIKPGAETVLTASLEGLAPGHRYKGTLAVDSREGGRRDQMTQAVDLTLLAAERAPDGHPDWAKIPAVDFSDWDPFGGPIAPEDCAATLQSAHSPRGLHLRIVVRDDSHLQTRSAEKLWEQDGLQIGLDPDAEKSWEANDLFGLKGHRVFEYGVGWTGKQALTWRWVSYLPELPVGVEEPRIQVTASRQEDRTEYVILFPWPTLGLKEAPKPGSSLGFALALTDADAGKETGRRVLRLFNGITDTKDAERFGKLWLR